jgi:predicted short-subunit dehydrogenase-like oxidoreductase (DUF2520 family)
MDPFGIVGTGRMAQALGATLCRRGVPVAAVAGNDREKARGAANFIGAPHATLIRDLPLYVKRILVAVSDDAIPRVTRELAACGTKPEVVLHTSGAAGPDALGALRTSGGSIGVIHPLQTVSSPEQGVRTLPASAFACAGDPEAVEWAQQLIRVLDGKALVIGTQNWELYHTAAVMACNYHVTLIDAALELMESAGIARDSGLAALEPLIRTTTDNILRSGPEAALTGPIRRGDLGTIRQHMAALKSASRTTRNLYSAAAVRTLPLAQRAGLPAEAVRQLGEAIEESGA